MIGMPLGKKSPKSELHEFYQLHPGNPTFTITSMSNPPAEPLFLCNLTCPAIGGPQGLPEQTFSGQGRNKKTAEQYASEKALDFLRQHGLLPPAMVQMPELQLPLDLQKQLANTQKDMAPLHKLQAQELSKGLSPTRQIAQPLQTPTTPNGGHVEEADGSGLEDYDSMEKAALVTKLKQEADSVNCRLRAEKFVPNLGLKQADKEEWHVVQALRENQRLKEEVAQEHQRRQVAIDLLLGANPQ